MLPLGSFTAEGSGPVDGAALEGFPPRWGRSPTFAFTAHSNSGEVAPPLGVWFRRRHPARMHVRLLGPCFKTGRSKPLRQASRARRRRGRGLPPNRGHALPRAPPRSERATGNLPGLYGRGAVRLATPPSRGPLPALPTDADPPGRRARPPPRTALGEGPTGDPRRDRSVDPRRRRGRRAGRRLGAPARGGAPPVP